MEVGVGGGEYRVVGDYILGEKIGSGSFAVVWRSRHRVLGVEVAVKEIDKKQLSSKVKEKENLLKEITILQRISHPNIIRLHEAIQTEEKIYLVLEYCPGGDLAAYIHRYGRVSETIARHFMRQLASGLQVLRENNLIHRDLKPQNLLLSNNDKNSVLKIGDFGFARCLMPQGLADTVCGSPLYMAPEIIQSQKYDAKADLWSVGAILFQLVTGKPPFDGNNQIQLFHNILTSKELQFPQDILRELHPDCIDLCKSLLRQNPVERLTFEEFFNHKFMAAPRTSGSASEFQPNTEDVKLSKALDGSDLGGKKVEYMDQGALSTNISKAGDSLESIERGYVLVNANLASVDTISSSIETLLQESSTNRPSNCILKKADKGLASQTQTEELATSPICGLENIGSHMSTPSTSSQALFESNVQGTSSFHLPTRLQLLYQFVHALSRVAQEKFNAGLCLESFSVELVALAVWKETLQVCNTWLSSTTGDAFDDSSASDLQSIKDNSLPPNLGEGIDFRKPMTVYSWAEQGFLSAFDRAEKISTYLRDMDGSAEMPDAMEIIFQTALSAGKSGAVDEFVGNWSSAAAAYSKATLLLSFILMEAMSLQLNPSFFLPVSDRQRIQRYITILQAHLKRSLILCTSRKDSEGSSSKHD